MLFEKSVKVFLCSLLYTKNSPSAKKKITSGHFFFSVVRFVFKNTLSAIEILSVALDQAVDKANPVTYIFTQRTSKIAM